MNLSRINQLLHESCQLAPNDTVVLGVSGGADSLALLEVLLELGFRPVVAHMDHGLRSSSRDESEFVAEHARQAGLECLIQRTAIVDFARVAKMSIEEAARTQRYRFLFKLAGQKKARAVLVAHTADDQVETVLMHLLRGSGLAGLQGMQVASWSHGWSDQIPLVRPLLETWRSEILTYCQEKWLVPVEDESNLDTGYLRNRIRQELIPTLATYNTEIKIALLRLSKNARQDYPVIQAAVENAWQGCLVYQKADALGFTVKKLQALPPAIQAGLIRRGVGCLLTDLTDLDQNAVERAMGFVRNPKPNRVIEITGGTAVSLVGGELLLARKGAPVPGAFPLVLEDSDSRQEIELQVPGHTLLDNGWKLSAEWVKPDEIKLPCDEWEVYLDAGASVEPIVVRSRREGDRFTPLGMKAGTVKLSDFMINEKIPGSVRNRWPLVCEGKGILWVVGYRQAEHTRIKKDTGKILHLYLNK